MIFSAIALMAFFTGCNDGFTVTESNDHRVSKTVSRIDDSGLCSGLCDENGLFIIEIDGHEYLVFNGYKKFGICHKADCKYCAINEESRRIINVR